MAFLTDLLGKTLSSIKNESNQITFICNDGKQYKMFHHQDCCESVWIEDIVGDLEDLIGSPILKVSEDMSKEPQKDYSDSTTWTFYNFTTIKGHVTMRWCGTSNGYYSESVDFEQIINE